MIYTRANDAANLIASPPAISTLRHARVTLAGARLLLAPKAQAAGAAIDKVAFAGINDAWALVALLTLAALVATPLAWTPRR